MDDQWIALKSSVQESISSQLLTKSRNYKDWISGDTLRLSASAKNARLQNVPDYRLLKREATRSGMLIVNAIGLNWQTIWKQLLILVTFVSYYASFVGLRASRSLQKPMYAMRADTLSLTLMRKSTNGQHTFNSF